MFNTAYIKIANHLYLDIPQLHINLQLHLSKIYMLAYIVDYEPNTWLHALKKVMPAHSEVGMKLKHIGPKITQITYSVKKTY